MTTTQILKEVEKLSPAERSKLMRRLANSTVRPRRKLWRPDPKALARFLAMAGAGKGPYRDVSSNKYKHLAEIYATKS